MTVVDGGALALEGWRLVRQMLDDLTATIEADAETELELLEGLRVLGRVDRAVLGAVARHRPAAPRFFCMNTPARLIGGPEPRRRVPPGHDRRPPPLPAARRTAARAPTSASRCWPASASPPGGWPPTCRTATCTVADDGTFALVLATDAADRRGAGRRPVAPDPRRRVGHRGPRVHRRPGTSRSPPTLAIEPLDPPAPARAAHRRVARRAADRHGVDDRQAHHAAPHDQARAARAAQRAGHGRGRRARRRRHHPRQPLHDRHLPPGAGRGAGHRARAARHALLERRRVENIWHECIDPRRRHSSITNAGAGPRRRRQGADRRRGHRSRRSATGSTPAAATAAS